MRQTVVCVNISSASSYHEARDRFEKEFLETKLRQFRWDVDATANAIELDRTNLYRKIKKLGIAFPRERSA